MAKLTRKKAKGNEIQLSKADLTNKTSPKQKKSKIPKPIRSFFKAIYAPFKWMGRKFIPSYFKHSFKELKLVTWPNWKESRQLTTAVVLFSLILCIAVSLVDLGLDKIFKKVILKQ
ncbi:MAG: preprotein translocase subunit SecE [bacterium]